METSTSFLPPIQKQLAEKQLEKFCATRIPAELKNEIQLKYTIEKNTVTLIETRPLWNDPSRWSELPVAIMMFDKESMTWQLYWIRANGKKELYSNLKPQKDLQKCIDEIDEDPLCTFWG